MSFESAGWMQEKLSGKLGAQFSKAFEKNQRL